ncbi:MAG: tetratricopeptide repeat protein [Elusimicrobiota bacterium]
MTTDPAKRIAELLQNGAHHEAFLLLDALAESCPDDCETLALLSWAFRLKGDNRRAADSASEAVEKHPRDVRGWIALAQARLEAGDLAGTGKAAKTAVELGPSIPHGKLLLAAVSEINGDAEAARRLLESPPEMNEHLPEYREIVRKASIKQFITLFEDGQYNKAFRLAQRLLESDGGSELLDVLRGPLTPPGGLKVGSSEPQTRTFYRKHYASFKRCRIQKRFSAFRLYYEYYLASYSALRVPRPWIDRITSLPVKGSGWMRYDMLQDDMLAGLDIIPKLRAIVDAWPKDCLMRCFLAEMLVAAGKSAEGFEEFERARAFNPQSPHKDMVNSWEAEMLLLLGRYREALALSRFRNPNDKLCLCWMGAAKIQLGDVEAGIALLSEHLAHANWLDKEAAVWRGEACRLLGRYDEALRDFDAVLSADPKYFWAHFNRALVHGKQGRPKKMQKDFLRIPASIRKYVARAAGSADMEDILELGLVLAKGNRRADPHLLNISMPGVRP